MKLVAAIGIFLWGVICGYALAQHLDAGFYAFLAVLGIVFCSVCGHILFREAA